jgi:hypothetical protein
MTDPVGSYAERKLSKRIQKLQQQLTELDHLVTTPPSVIVYNIQELINESSNDWAELVKNFLNSININTNWILDVINPSNSKDPEYITIQLISHCVKDKVYTIISNYVLEKNINALITKDYA